MVNRVGIGVSQKQQHFALRTIYLVSTGSVFYRSHTGEMCVCVCVCVCTLNNTIVFTLCTYLHGVILLTPVIKCWTLDQPIPPISAYV